MPHDAHEADARSRGAPIEIEAEDFRRLGHDVVDAVADFLGSLPDRPVAPGEDADEVRAALGAAGLPEAGTAPAELLREAADLLFEHSTFNGHPRFLAYITASGAPIGILGELLAAAVNPNVGAWPLAPLASELEAQTVRWVAELLGYPACGGLLVSGGNMANFVGLLAARRAKAPWDIRTDGLAAAEARPLRLYASRETHTWLEKAADLFGLGTESIRWIETDGEQRLVVPALREQIARDRETGALPVLAVGTAGSVSTGAVDPLAEMATLCREEDVWFHVDGAYGAPAAALPDAPADLKALALADSVAVDPHKWLYAPLEAGCALVREPRALLEAFTYRPPYYSLPEGEDAPINFVDYGPQNSRGFRALKVWLGLRQVGRAGYVRMIADDIALARELHRLAAADPELEARTTSLSITTFRYVPAGVEPAAPEAERYLNELNQELRDRLERGGETFLSNAVVDDAYLLRACIVNFRTDATDLGAILEIVKRVGSEIARDRNPPGR